MEALHTADIIVNVGDAPSAPGSLPHFTAQGVGAWSGSINMVAGARVACPHGPGLATSSGATAWREELDGEGRCQRQGVEVMQGVRSIAGSTLDASDDRLRFASGIRHSSEERKRGGRSEEAVINGQLDLIRRVSDAELRAISERNSGYQFERTAEGRLVVSPTGGERGRQSNAVSAQLPLWNSG